MDDNLTAPLTAHENFLVSHWAVKFNFDYYYGPFEGKTPGYVALMLSMDGYTVKDGDVLKAAGRL